MFENNTYQSLGKSLETSYEKWLAQCSSDGLGVLLDLPGTLYDLNARLAQMPSATTTMPETELAYFFANGFLPYPETAAPPEATDEPTGLPETARHRPSVPEKPRTTNTNSALAANPQLRGASTEPSGTNAAMIPSDPQTNRTQKLSAPDPVSMASKATPVSQPGSAPPRHNTPLQGQPDLPAGHTDAPLTDADSSSGTGFKKIGSISDWVKVPRALEAMPVGAPEAPGTDASPTTEAQKHAARRVITPPAPAIAAPDQARSLEPEDSSQMPHGNTPAPAAPFHKQRQRENQPEQAAEMAASAANAPDTPLHAALPAHQYPFAGQSTHYPEEHTAPAYIFPDRPEMPDALPYDLIELLTKQLKEAYQRYYGHAH